VIRDHLRAEAARERLAELTGALLGRTTMG
jgi:hypothetical protein